ncbi:MAG: hypothetical protein OXL34_01670 [Gemmatimonadota bacterium]|nr:hypothetical protein [Gemmatimonadota bacterium]
MAAPITRPPPPTLMGILCLLTLSCGDATRDPATTTDIPLTATTEPLYTVGALVGDDWETFGSVRSVHFDADGNLHIFDARAHRMVVVGSEGNHLRTVGTQGEGPGEIQNAHAAAVLADGRTVLYDFSNPAAFEIFDREGEFERSVTADVNRGVPGDQMLPLPNGRLVTKDGPKMRVYAPGELPDDSQEEEEEDHRRDIDVFSLDGSDKVVLYRAWDLPPTEADESIEGSSEEAGGLSMSFNRMREFNPRLLIGVLSDGRVAVVDSIAYEVKLVAGDGTVDGTITRRIAPEPVTEAVREATRTDRLEGLGEATGGGIRLSTIGGEVNLGDMQAQLHAMIVRQVETMIFTEEIPVIANLAVDPRDRLWIARMGPMGDAAAGPTDILEADGRYIGTLPADGLRIPAAFGPNGLMAYIDSDEMGVETVRVIRLVSLDG